MNKSHTTSLKKIDAKADRKRILVVDDHPMMRAGLVQLINRQPDMLVCAEAGQPTEVFAVFTQARPDMILTDLSMPGRSGLEFIKDLLALRPDLLILVMSLYDEAIYAERCLRAGAHGYLMKETGSVSLLVALRCVLDGQIYVRPKVSQSILGNLCARKPRGSDSPIRALSDREFEVFQQIGQGKSMRQIAETMHLSPKTIESHRANIRKKLDLKDATSLVCYATRWFESQNLAS